jgi:hypothetical protein
LRRHLSEGLRLVDIRLQRLFEWFERRIWLSRHRLGRQRRRAGRARRDNHEDEVERSRKHG